MEIQVQYREETVRFAQEFLDTGRGSRHVLGLIYVGSPKAAKSLRRSLLPYNGEGDEAVPEKNLTEDMREALGKYRELLAKVEADIAASVRDLDDAGIVDLVI